VKFKATPTFVLLDLYSKGEKEDVPVSELKKILVNFLSK